MKLITCRGCSSKFDVSPYPPGKRFRCAKCKGILTVPEDALEDELPPVPEPEPEPEPAETDAAEEAPAPRSDGRRAIAARARSARAPARPAAADPVEAEPAKKRSPAVKIAAALLLAGAFGGGGYFAWLKFGKGGSGGEGGAEEVAGAYERRVAKLTKSSATGHLSLALWCKSNGHDKYEHHLREAAKLEPGDARVKAGLAEFYWTRLSAKPPASAADCLALAADAEAAGLLEEKRRLARLALAQEPGNADAWTALGCVRYEPPEGAEGPATARWMPKVEAEKLAKEAADRKAALEKVATLSEREKRVLELQSTLQLEFGDFVFRDDKPFLFCMQKSESISADLVIEDYVGELKAFYNRFFDRYGEKFKLGDLSEQVMLMWIFKDRANYATYGNRIGGLPPGAGGHFEPANERLLIFHEVGGNADPYGTIFHETTHMIVHFATKLRGSVAGQMLWFTEGLATYFESFERDGKGKILQNPDTVNKGRLPQIRAEAGRGRHVKLTEMLAKTYREFGQEMSDQRTRPESRAMRGALYYAEAWSLVYFFYNYSGGKYATKFEEYFAEELVGRSGLDTFKKIFGSDLDALEKEWLEFTKSLK
jgi:hypothetical protein